MTTVTDTTPVRTKPAWRITPRRLLISVIGSIFIAEMVAMIVFTGLPSLPPFVEALLDATLLSALVLPVLYVLVFRQIVTEAAEREHAEEALQRERRLLRTLIDNLPDGVYVKDAAGRKLVANRADVNLIGATSETDVLGKTDLDLFPNEAGARGYADDITLMQSGQPLLNHEEDFVDVHGARRWLLTSKVPLRDEHGQITGLLGIGHDITDRKQADEQLRQLSRAVEHSPVSIVITDLTGRIQYVNPWFSQLTGYTAEEAIDQNPRVLKSGHTSPEEYSQLWQTISAGRTWHGEFHNKKKNGELYWELASISPITDAHGQVTHYVAVKEDITERKQAEAVLRESESRYRERAAELQTIMDAVPAAVWIAHDQMCRVITGNRAAYERFRLPPDTNASLTAPTDLPQSHPKICQNGVELPPNDLPLQVCAATGVEISDFEEDLVFDGGTVINEVGNVRPLFDEAGRPRGAVGVFVNITERKRAEETLTWYFQEVGKEKQYFESLVRNNPVATVVISPSNEVVSWNPAAEQPVWLCRRRSDWPQHHCSHHRR